MLELDQKNFSLDFMFDINPMADIYVQTIFISFPLYKFDFSDGGPLVHFASLPCTVSKHRIGRGYCPIRCFDL